MTTQSVHTSARGQLTNTTDLQVISQPDHIRLVNNSHKRIVFFVKTAMKKATTTATGVLDANESTLLMVKCDGTEATDRLTIIYTNPPEGTPKHYTSDFFTEDNFVKRKNLPNRFPKIVAVLSKHEKSIQ